MQSPVRWGILGTARITRRVAPAIQSAPAAKLIAIASRSEEKAKAWAEKYECPQIVESYEQLLERDDVDVVYIPLPPHLHAEWTIKAAQAGKHVLCEKPLALNALEAETMVNACQQAGVCFEEGVMWYHHPRATQIRDILNQGRLGEIRRVTSAFSFPWQSSVEPSEEYRFKQEQGGGSLMDLGWYCVGASLWTLGMLPEEVFGREVLDGSVDESFSGWMRFANGAEAAFDCSRNMTSRRWIEIAGTEGSIVCDDFTRPWQEEKTRFWIHDAQGNAEVVNCEAATQETCLIENFSQRILTGQLDNQQSLGLKTQQVMDRLLKSAKSKRNENEF
ncbi:Gfo/Idh/MocA family protein [Rubinisphaera italica]|uniref:1,5-anhydro-D-fructose reductase n=1 Tax=Rubinisphaera italica TaxID=2527969 RepID=A0A5C5XLY5_9PLAN|nr:Gfo/Idh/MocA family oxidoreductase [Rubinisphaera italica]TWT63894.1 1,5-anhydro-D-fructose reductase [Rubinisphaera italica]